MPWCPDRWREAADGGDVGFIAKVQAGSEHVTRSLQARGAKNKYINIPYKRH